MNYCANIFLYPHSGHWLTFQLTPSFVQRLLDLEDVGKLVLALQQSAGGGGFFLLFQLVLLVDVSGHSLYFPVP